MERVGVVIATIGSGGAERVAANLSIALSERYEVHLIVFDGTNICYPYGGILHDLQIPAASSLVAKARNLIRRTIQVRRLKKQYGITSSISFMDGANLVNVLSRAGDRCITSVRIHMSKCVTPKKLPVFRAVQRFIAARSYKVVAVSLGVQEDLHEVFRIPERKLTTIYNPCDYQVLRKEALTNPIQLPAGHALITIGRLTEQKGQWHLIRAVAEAKKTIPDIKLYILGEGELRDKLQELIHELGLEDDVRLLGYMKAPHACFQCCDAYVSSSEYEGMTNVLLEAMAFGMPCIATDCYSGSREIMAPGTEVRERLADIEYAEYGILTSVCGPNEFGAEAPLTGEERQMAKAIVEMLTNAELREGYAKKSLERAKDFAPDRIEKAWEHLLSGKD